MKKYVIIFLIIMCVSTVMAGGSSQPAMMKPGLTSQITEARSDPNQRDNMIGELRIVDGYRPHAFMKDVKEQKSNDDQATQIDFPQYGRFK